LANNKKRFNLFEFFNGSKDGPGVIKEEANSPRDIKFFFKLYWRNIGRICTANLYYIFGNFPIFFGLLGFYFMESTTAASSSLFGPVSGAVAFNASPVTAALFGVHGAQVATNVPSSTSYLFWLLTLLVIFTFGFVNVGCAYIMRAIVKGQHFSLFSDFFSAIKRNLKQGFFMGIVDAILIAACVYAMAFYYMVGSQLFLVSIIMMCFYVMMRYYFYIMLITFDLSIWKIIKNSLIFTLLGFKRNILAFIGGLLMIFIEYMVLNIFMPLGIIFPFVLFFSVPMFFGTFAAYPKVKEIMIDPQLQ